MMSLLTELREMAGVSTYKDAAPNGAHAIHSGSIETSIGAHL